MAAVRKQAASATGKRKQPGKQSGETAGRSVALRIAEARGLFSGPKTKHVNAKVPPRLFDAAARRVGTTSPAVVITAALAALATEDELGPWLARNWGVLADTPPELLDQIEF
jgi:hypothetical protein